MKVLNALLALCGGLIGGVISHQFLSQPAQTVIPNVVTAERFVLVDGVGGPLGTFTTLPQLVGAPAIVLFDALGREIWRATNSPRQLTLANSN